MGEIKTVDDLIAALRQYDGERRVVFEHATSEEWESGDTPLYEYTVDAVVFDLDTDTIRLMSIGEWPDGR
jgi:hypothetical protein